MSLLQHFFITSKTLPNKDIIAIFKDEIKVLVKEEADRISAKIILTLRNSKLHKYNFSKNECKVSILAIKYQFYLYQLLKVDLLVSFTVKTI